MKPDFKETLHNLYRDHSKHDSYQSIPGFIADILGYQEEIDQNWRGDHSRLNYFISEFPFDRISSLADVGANTGFFTLSLAHRYHHLFVSAYEPNPNHARLIRILAKSFGIANVKAVPKGVSLGNSNRVGKHDAVLHLNVLHHAGFDFDPELPREMSHFTEYSVRYLSGLGKRFGWMIFQMGSNWGGDKSRPLIARDDHAGKLIYFSSLLVKGGWELVKIAYPLRTESGEIVYRNLPAELVNSLNFDPESVESRHLDSEISRFNLDQFPGEFYKRPMFICKSLHIS